MAVLRHRPGPPAEDRDQLRIKVQFQCYRARLHRLSREEKDLLAGHYGPDLSGQPLDEFRAWAEDVLDDDDRLELHDAAAGMLRALAELERAS